MNRLFRADIHAAGWRSDVQHPRLALNAASKQHLLLIAAGECGDGLIDGMQPHIETTHQVHSRLSQARGTDEAMAGMNRVATEMHVLAHTALRHDAISLALLRHHNDADSRRVSG